MACIIVLMIGIMIFLGMFSAGIKIDDVVVSYFNATNYADAFATVVSMPKSVLTKLEKIEGVKEADGRFVKDVKAKLSDSVSIDDLVKVKLVGIDASSGNYLNKYTYTGAEPGNDDGIWLSKGFYEANAYNIGDDIYIIINGALKAFNVCGYIESPMYLSVNGEFPSEGKESAGFIKEKILYDLTDSSGMITDLAFELNDNVKFKDVKDEIENILKPYGLISLIEQKNHEVYLFINSTVSVLYSVVAIIPAFFLLISIIMLYIILKRCIEQERTEIGVLKAMGFLDKEIINGYMIYAFIIATSAFILALLFGYMAGVFFYNMVLEAYTLPYKPFSFPFHLLIISYFLALLSCFIAVRFGAKSIITIQPAEAMRPPAPKVFRIKKKRKKMKFKLLDFRKILGIRGVVRNKARSVLTAVSIIIAFTLVNLFFASMLSYNKAIDSHVTILEPYDLRVSLDSFMARNDALKATAKINGVTDTEGLLLLPVTISYHNRSIEMTMSGIDKDSKLYNVIDSDYSKQKIPEHGILINSRKAEQLNAKEGDTVRVESPYLKDGFNMTIAGVIDEPERMGCYVDLTELSSAFNSKNAVNNVLLKISPGSKHQIQQELVYAKNVAEVIDQELAGEQLIENSSSLIMLFVFLIVLSIVMCFGIVYNVSRISLIEKFRELITMKVIGFTNNEVSEIGSFENWLLFAPSILIGLILSVLLKEPLAYVIRDEDFALVIEMSLTSILFAIICCMCAVILSNYISKKQIKRYNIIEVIKEKQ